MIRFFKCKCGKKDEDNLFQLIVDNKEIPIELKLFKLILRDANLIKDFVSKKEDEFGLTQAQMNVLWVIRVNDEILTQMDIAKRIGSSKANMSTLIDRMENLDLIERVENKENKKIKNIKLTKLGKEKIENHLPKIVPELKKLFKGFTKKETDDFFLLLDKLRGNLNENI